MRPESVANKVPHPEFRRRSRAQEGESYEITAYKSLMKLADQMGLSEASDLFQENPKEEEQTAQEVESVSLERGRCEPPQSVDTDQVRNRSILRNLRSKRFSEERTHGRVDVPGASFHSRPRQGINPGDGR
jgi:hypothetical protein